MMFTLLPLDHYTALGIAQDAPASEIRAAYAIAVAEVSATRYSRVMGPLFGRSPARLNRACAELLDPLNRRDYDKYLDDLRVRFANPPP